MMRFSRHIFFSSFFVSNLGDQLLLFLVPLLVFKTTGSVALSGLSYAVEALPRVLFFPICGVLCDRFSPTNLLKISQVWRAVICLVGFAGYYAIENIAWIVVMSAICGVLTTQGFMAREVMLPQVFAGQRFSRVQSISQSVDQSCIIVGPLVAAALFNWLGWEAVVSAAAVLFISAEMIMAVWRVGNTVPLNPPEQFKGNWTLPIKVALDHIINLPGLKRVIALTALVNLVFGVTLATSASMVTGLFEKSDSHYALLQTIGAVSTIMVLLLVGTSRLSLGGIGLLSYFLVFLGGITTAISGNFELYAVGYALILGFDSLFNVYIRSIRQKIIPKQDYGKTTGVIILFNNLTLPIAGLVVGLAAHPTEVGWVILGLTLFMGLVGISLAKTEIQPDPVVPE